MSSMVSTIISLQMLGELKERLQATTTLFSGYIFSPPECMFPDVTAVPCGAKTKITRNHAWNPKNCAHDMKKITISEHRYAQ